MKKLLIVSILMLLPIIAVFAAKPIADNVVASFFHTTTATESVMHIRMYHN